MEAVILIGENINVMSKRFSEAFKSREKKVIQEAALALAEAGMDYLDLNIGPARKHGPELMRWLVETIEEVVDIPLFLDTKNVEAMRAGLEACKKAKPVINSISCKEEEMEVLFPLAKQYDVPFVALLLTPEGIPRDANERGMVLAEFLTKAEEEGISPEKLWVDPIVLPVSSQQNHVRNVVEFMMMFKELAPGCMSTCGLSNVSNGTPTELRPILNRTYLSMLKRLGMESAIVDGFDKELIEIARGKRPDIEELVAKAMDKEVDLSILSDEERGYVKTVDVLLGRSLYSHSWLKV